MIKEKSRTNNTCAWYGPDYLTVTGAEVLAMRIREFWVKHGVQVKTWVERVGTSRADNHAPMYVVKSDLKICEHGNVDLWSSLRRVRL